jgi:hypothetical protein
MAGLRRRAKVMRRLVFSARSLQRPVCLMPYCPRCYDCDGDDPQLEPYICNRCWPTGEEE